MKALVIGYGRMGKMINEVLGDELAGNVALECPCKTIKEFDKDFDVIIDFSNPANLDMIIEYVKETKKPVVFATTGYSDSQLKQIDDLSKVAPVLRSANFSLGVIVLNRVVKEMSALLKDDYDIEVIEAHHNKKLDAPSGTAKMLIKSIVDETGFTVNEGRKGICPRTKNEVGVSAIRGGTIPGIHQVMYCGEDEVLEFKHTAYSRRIFATGAVKAAKWLLNQKPGFYDMNDVLFGNNK
jgi:4-hydroxy-tetrahydrodipicolinate reductase